MGYCGRILNSPAYDWDYTGDHKAADWHRIASIRCPSVYVNLTDGARSNVLGTWGLTSWVMYPQSMWRTGDATYDGPTRYARHSNAANLALGDGHVESIARGKMVKTNNDGDIYDYYWFPGCDIRGGDANH